MKIVAVKGRTTPRRIKELGKDWVRDSITEIQVEPDGDGR